MKTVIKTALAFSALAALAGCGLRGDLERPPPIFSDPPSEEAQKPVDSPAVFAQAPIDQNRVYYNSLGGEIPKPAPEANVDEDAMSEVSPG
ncbi:MAG: lipoprotein [Pseudomonadota bacterium]